MKFLSILTLALSAISLAVAAPNPNPEPATVTKVVVVKASSSGSTSYGSSSGSTSYSSSSGFGSSFKKSTADLHNNVRAATGKKLQKLVWSDKRAQLACSCAKKWANSNGVSDCAAGENSWKHSAHISDVEAIKGAMSSFAAEKKYYKAGQKIGSGYGTTNYGHYTQGELKVQVTVV
ncbi:hypothetical protein HDV00_009988 [Rhizophlyctis rosea]|nr:hypothetical protein HDV00_009988 [Rhizophlyctis rosea]